MINFAAATGNLNHNVVGPQLDGVLISAYTSPGTKKLGQSKSWNPKRVNSPTDIPDKTLDARNLTCPLPILKTKRALNDVAVGGLLEVLTTDPGSVDDFIAFADSTGNTLLHHSRCGNGNFRFLLRREA